MCASVRPIGNLSRSTASGWGEQGAGNVFCARRHVLETAGKPFVLGGEPSTPSVGTGAKLRLLEGLIRRHKNGRVIIFTSDNATVYAISQTLLLPAITHQTTLVERQTLLADFASGELPVLVTSRVLNEGVDIPSADVAIVLSGSSDCPRACATAWTYSTAPRGQEGGVV